MFASIPNFWDFYRQTTVSKHGIECLKVLNEIIGEFDEVKTPSEYLFRITKALLFGLFGLSRPDGQSK